MWLWNNPRQTIRCLKTVSTVRHCRLKKRFLGIRDWLYWLSDWPIFTVFHRNTNFCLQHLAHLAYFTCSLFECNQRLSLKRLSYLSDLQCLFACSGRVLWIQLSCVGRTAQLQVSSHYEYSILFMLYIVVPVKVKIKKIKWLHSSCLLYTAYGWNIDLQQSLYSN